jgi:hypothetical protein
MNGHHFKHYQQFNPMCFPSTDVQKYVMLQDLDDMALAFGIDQGLMLKLATVFRFISNNQVLSHDVQC